MLRVTCGPMLGTWSSGPLHVLQGLQADVGEREAIKPSVQVRVSKISVSDRSLFPPQAVCS